MRQGEHGGKLPPKFGQMRGKVKKLPANIPQNTLNFGHFISFQYLTRYFQVPPSSGRYEAHTLLLRDERPSLESSKFCMYFSGGCISVKQQLHQFSIIIIIQQIIKQIIIIIIFFTSVLWAGYGNERANALKLAFLVPFAYSLSIFFPGIVGN